MVVSLRAVAWAAVLSLANLTAAGAQDVTLSSGDGSFTLSGTLIAYDGEFLRLETEFGPMTVDAADLTCDGPGCPLLGTAIAEVLVVGASVIAERLVPPVLEAFAAHHDLTLTRDEDEAGAFFDLEGGAPGMPVLRLRLTASSSDAGLMALVSGEADLALSFTPLDGPEFNLHVLALDAFVPVVANDAPVAAVSVEALLQVVEGEVDTWAALGGPDVPLRLHFRELGTGEQYALGAHLLALGGEGVTAQATHHADNAAVEAAVSADPFALALMLRSQAEAVRLLPLAAACGTDLRADPFALKAGEYPLAQALYAVQLRRRLPLRLRQFLDFFDSGEGALAIRAAGFTDTLPEPVPATARGQRLFQTLLTDPNDETLLEELRELAHWGAHAEQLSLALRFEPGTAQIDAQSQVLIRQLARRIEAGQFNGQEVVLVGFTDSQGARAVNRQLARSRAEAVQQALIEAAPLRQEDQVTISAIGFGPLLPIACNEAEWGRALNRRVEVWLRPLP